ncbi:protein translocase subunit SecD [Phenylobacterium sp.]|uniref:protein translocase subunit SecD n=1 Tax=Phenylobacterium sp. TaxID=1871053 RepID=UPI001229CB54|nr:protein translocase subunit SecD [Phenylobacterium sp.]THD70337.1 MAG: protein translocase subunit SecD [Phenylobacterium sp.]
MMNLARWKVIVVVLATVLGLLFSLPNVLPAHVRESLPGFMPKSTLHLGLDLQGGSYLLYSVDTAALRTERLTNMAEDVRTGLRDKNIAFTELAVINGQIGLRITDPTQVTAAANLLRGTIGAPLSGTTGGRDVTVSTSGDQRIVVAFVPAAFDAEASKAVEQNIEVIRRRVDTTGAKEINPVRQGKDRIVIEAAGENDPEKLKSLIGQTAKLTFQMVDDQASPEDIAAGRIPPGDEVIPSSDGLAPQYLVKRRAPITGEMLTNAQPGFDQQGGTGALVQFRMNSLGSTRFAEITRSNIGKRFAIVLDKKVIEAPTIQGVIPSGSGQITGHFTPESANELSVLLRAGALPAPMKVEEQRTVGAELGADAVKAGATSAIVGLVATMIFMLLIYGGLFGGISLIALAVNAVMIIGVMSFTQATLTLPGIAGLILTLAVAVDANVLIYERMRDELRAGRSVIAAMEAGFARAWGTIFDANMTHIFSALIMFNLGSGPVKGFAWTLAIGVFTTVFSAVLVTQVLLAWWFKTARPKTLPIA